MKTNFLKNNLQSRRSKINECDMAGWLIGIWQVGGSAIKTVCYSSSAGFIQQTQNLPSKYFKEFGL
jgi:hypothetical protein